MTQAGEIPSQLSKLLRNQNNIAVWQSWMEDEKKEEEDILPELLQGKRENEEMNTSCLNFVSYCAKN